MPHLRDQSPLLGKFWIHYCLANSVSNGLDSVAMSTHSAGILVPLCHHIQLL